MRIGVVGGAGAMGSVTVADLAGSAGITEVVIVDPDIERARALAERLDGRGAALVARGIDAPLAVSLAGCAAVVNASGHAHNIAVMEACLEVGAHYTDLGGLFHVAVRQYDWHQRFVDAGLTATLSMGSAPGLTNLMAARGVELGQLDTVESIEIADAVVPGRQYHPSEPYGPPYAALTLIEEYTAPAPQFVDGAIGFYPAGSGARTYAFPGGEVECVYTIHSEPATLPRSYADRGIQRVEWRLGLAPADHVRLLSFVASGLASEEPVVVNGVSVRPADVLIAVLARQARADAATPDPDAVEWFRVITTGSRDGARVTVTCDVKVTDPPSGEFSGGAWVTGVPPSIAAQIMASGRALRTGVHGPELTMPLDLFFTELAGRGMIPLDQIDD
ncbi:MAG: saccharopine dehydrogenase family protein [Actinomycetota bacterium]